MPKLRVHAMSMSLDGYAAGAQQSRDEPLGMGGERLHTWMFRTRHWHEMAGRPGGEEGVDNDLTVEGLQRYDTVVVPDAWQVSPEQHAVLCAYAESSDSAPDASPRRRWRALTR